MYYNIEIDAIRFCMMMRYAHNAHYIISIVLSRLTRDVSSHTIYAVNFRLSAKPYKPVMHNFPVPIFQYIPMNIQLICQLN